MSQDKSDYEKKIAKANAARQRQFDKQTASLAIKITATCTRKKESTIR